MNFSKILVTGGLGFIGSCFIKQQLTKEIEIINLDKKTYASNEYNLIEVKKNPRYTFVEGDIRDKDIVRKILEGCDAIVNFAAETHVDNSIKADDEFIKTNIEGTHNLLKCALNSEIKKFVQVSTDEVYGSIREGKFTEEDKLSPSSPYSASKASADLLCNAYYTTFQLPVTITRSSNNFGPNQHAEKLVPKIILNALNNKQIPIYGTGKNIRDWIYVEQNAEAIDFVLEKGKNGQTYNIAGNNEKTNLEIVREILKITKKPETLIVHVEDRKGHDFRYAILDEKINALGYTPQCEDFKNQLEKTVAWYTKNQEWCKTCRTF